MRISNVSAVWGNRCVGLNAITQYSGIILNLFLNIDMGGQNDYQ